MIRHFTDLADILIDDKGESTDDYSNAEDFLDEEESPVKYGYDEDFEPETPLQQSVVSGLDSGKKSRVFFPPSPTSGSEKKQSEDETSSDYSSVVDDQSVALKHSPTADMTAVHSVPAAQRAEHLQALSTAPAELTRMERTGSADSIPTASPRYSNKDEIGEEKSSHSNSGDREPSSASAWTEVSPASPAVDPPAPTAPPQLRRRESADLPLPASLSLLCEERASFETNPVQQNSYVSNGIQQDGSNSYSKSLSREPPPALRQIRSSFTRAGRYSYVKPVGNPLNIPSLAQFQSRESLASRDCTPAAGLNRRMLTEVVKEVLREAGIAPNQVNPTNRSVSRKPFNIINISNSRKTKGPTTHARFISRSSQDPLLQDVVNVPNYDRYCDIAIEIQELIRKEREEERKRRARYKELYDRKFRRGFDGIDNESEAVTAPRLRMFDEQDRDILLDILDNDAEIEEDEESEIERLNAPPKRFDPKDKEQLHPPKTQSGEPNIVHPPRPPFVVTTHPTTSAHRNSLEEQGSVLRLRLSDEAWQYDNLRRSRSRSPLRKGSPSSNQYQHTRQERHQETSRGLSRGRWGNEYKQERRIIFKQAEIDAKNRLEAEKSIVSVRKRKKRAAGRAPAALAAYLSPTLSWSDKVKQKQPWSSPLRRSIHYAGGGDSALNYAMPTTGSTSKGREPTVSGGVKTRAPSATRAKERASTENVIDRQTQRPQRIERRISDVDRPVSTTGRATGRRIDAQTRSAGGNGVLSIDAESTEVLQQRGSNEHKPKKVNAESSSAGQYDKLAVTRPDITRTCERVYATFIRDIVDVCRRRSLLHTGEGSTGEGQRFREGEVGQGVEELAMQRVLSQHVADAFAGPNNSVQAIRTEMLKAAMEVTPYSTKATTRY